MKKATRKLTALIFASLVLMLGFVPACRPKAKYGGPPDSYKRVPALEQKTRQG